MFTTRQNTEKLKKKTAKIVDSSSVNYTFKNSTVYLQPKETQNDELDQKKSQKYAKRSIKDYKIKTDTK